MSTIVEDRRPTIPLRWKVLDSLEHLFEAVVGRRMRRGAPYIWLLPAGMLVGLLAVGTSLMVLDSFHQLDRDTFLLSPTYSAANYKQLVSQSVFEAVLLRSISYSVIVTVITVPLSFPYAYVMVRTPSPLKRRVLLFALFVPFFVGSVVRAYSWIVVLGRHGLANDILGLFGIEPMKILYTQAAIVIGLTQYLLPFAVLMIAPALTSVPDEIEMAAESLGASWGQTLLRIVLPLCKPGIVAATIVVFTLSLTDYAMPTMMGGGTFDFVSNLVYDVFFGMSDWGLGSAFMLVLVLTGTLLVLLILAVFDLPVVLKRLKR